MTHRDAISSVWERTDYYRVTLLNSLKKFLEFTAVIRFSHMIEEHGLLHSGGE
jgi:hypothetical protein